MHKWLCKGLIFTLVTLTVFPWVREGGKRRETLCPIFPHFIGGPSRGLNAQTIVDKPAGPYAGGVRGGWTNPLYWLSIATYYTIYVIDSRSTTGIVRLEIRDKSRIILAHRKESGVARLRGSHFMSDIGWVWICGRRNLLTDDSPRPPPRTSSSSDDIASTVGAMCLTRPFRTYTRVRLTVVSMKRGSDVSGATPIFVAERYLCRSIVAISNLEKIARL